MDYLFSITGSGARVVRDAISQRLWPGSGQESVESQPYHAGTTAPTTYQHSIPVLSKTGQWDTQSSQTT